MKKLALSLAIGAAALLGASAVNAAPAQQRTQAPAASHIDSAAQATDMSSRHWRGVHRWHRSHWGFYRHRPVFRSYAFYPRTWRRVHRWHRFPRWGYYRPYRPVYRSYAYYPQYYNPAPAVSFGIGFGGPRFGFGGPRWHRHWW